MTLPFEGGPLVPRLLGSSPGGAGGTGSRPLSAGRVPGPLGSPPGGVGGRVLGQLSLAPGALSSLPPIALGVLTGMDVQDLVGVRRE